MRLRIPGIVALLCLAASCAMPDDGEALASFVNGDFEDGLSGWKVGAADKMSALSLEQAASGKHALKIVDNDTTTGCDVAGPRIPITRSGVYRLTGKCFPVSGRGIGIYIRAYDKNGKVLSEGTGFNCDAPSFPLNSWQTFHLDAAVTGEVAALQLWIHSYSGSTATAYLDDFAFQRIGGGATAPPWPGTYKIRPEETKRLTAADVVGPDGIVYPDWRYAGVPGGIPTTPVVAKVEEFGGRANTQQDCSAALAKAIAAAAKRGGGAIVFGPGAYYLDRPVTITQDNIVLRGAGADKTRLVFRYAPPTGSARFQEPLPNTALYADTPLEVHADAKGLQSLHLAIDGQEFAQARIDTANVPQEFWLRSSGGALKGKMPAGNNGSHTLTVTAVYTDGRRTETRLQTGAVTPSATSPTAPRVPSQIGAIMFAGVSSNGGPKWLLAQDGKRGDREIVLESADGVAAGDRIRLRAPATPRWNALVRNEAIWGDFRRYEFLVEAVNGNRVRLNQPLRLEYPRIDGSYIQKITPVRRCGVESLALEQTSDLWATGVVFSNAWECWMRGVTVKKAGRNPFYAAPAKWCEVRDCTFDDAWYKGGGGTAYVEWEYACDCLATGLKTFRLRHAPQVGWAASGNVFRDSVFQDSDGHWHSGWTNENLFENCSIVSVPGNGSYGYGLWASPPEDKLHGPQGPRNVVYGCSISSPQGGLWMGGMNEAWLILYNRFDVRSGPGVYARTASFDHIIRGNVFTLHDASQPAVFLATADCTGVDFVHNIVQGGNGKLVVGEAKVGLTQNNTLGAIAQKSPSPTPSVPSIFEWQRKATKQQKKTASSVTGVGAP